MTEFDSLSIFLTTAEEMNFTRAAEKLFMTQQNLSAHIKRLERAYGVELFLRKPYLKLTPEGESMVFFAKQILETESSMINRFADINSDSMGILRLGISHQRCDVFFPDIWNLYHPTHKNISIRLHERMTAALIEELQNNRVDVILGIDIPSTANLEVIPLAEEQIRCIIHEKLIKTHYPKNWKNLLKKYEKEGVDLADLKSIPILVLPNNNNLRKSIEQIFQQNHIMPPIALETSSHSLILNLSCKGDGIGIINPLAIFQRLSGGKKLPEKCHVYKIKGTPKYTVTLAYRKDFTQPSYVLDMVDCFKEEFSYYRSLMSKEKI